MSNFTNAVNLESQGTVYVSITGVWSGLDASTAGFVLTSNGTGVAPAFKAPATSGTVTSVSVVSANGLAGTVATATTTPAITLSTTQTGVLVGNGTAISGVTGANDGVLITDNTGVISWLANSGTPGWVLTANAGQPPSWQAASGGSITFAGDTGTPFSTSSVTIEAGTSSVNCGSTVSFNASTPNIELNVTDSHNNTGIGKNTLNVVSTGIYNTALGSGALQAATSSCNNSTAIGGLSLNALVGPISACTAIGYGTLNVYNGAGGGQVAIGYIALGSLASDATSMGLNVSIGHQSATNLLTGEFNVIIGGASAVNYTGAESSNILIGSGVSGTTAESNVLRIGNATGTSSGNIAQGSAFIQGIYGATPSSPQMVTINSAGNLGSQAIPGGGGGITTLNGNSGPATGSTVTITTGGSNASGTALFTGSGATVTMTASDSNHNTGWGTNALAGATTTTGNVAIGDSALSSLSTSAHGVNNVAIGYLALQTLNPASSANPCIAIGFNALNAYNGTTGGQVAVGQNALFSLTGDATGNGNNFALGTSCAGNLLTGEGNIMIGVATANSYSGAESSNILIGNVVFGVTGESNVLRIGSATGTGLYQLNAAFIQGIAGITVASSAAVLIDTSTGQLGTVPSAARYKENIEDMKDESEVIYKLRPVRYNLKDHPEFGIQTGLVADEVQQVAPRLVSLNPKGQPESVSYHELPAMLLNEIQKLRKEVDQLKAKRG